MTTIAKIKADIASSSKFAHLRHGADQRAAEHRAQMTAKRILRAAAEARGEKFDAAGMERGPQQQKRLATADGIIAAAREIGLTTEK